MTSNNQNNEKKPNANESENKDQKKVQPGTEQNKPGNK
jgi:hypothetical protein